MATLPADQQIALCLLAQAGDIAARDRLIAVLAPLLARRAVRWMRTSPLLEVGDLVAEGTLGAMRAIELFDARKGASFVHYAAMWINARMNNACNRYRLRGLSGGSFGRVNPVLAYETGRALGLEHEDALERAGVRCRTTAETVWFRLAATEAMVQLDAPLDSADDSDMTIGETLASERESIEEVVVDAWHRGRVVRAAETAMATMPARTQDIIRRRYLVDTEESETLQDIGDSHGVTRERTRQIEEQALALLKTRVQALLRPAPKRAPEPVRTAEKPAAPTKPAPKLCKHGHVRRHRGPCKSCLHDRYMRKRAAGTCVTCRGPAIPQEARCAACKAKYSPPQTKGGGVTVSQSPSPPGVIASPSPAQLRTRP